MNSRTSLLSPNPSSLKSRFAGGLLRALTRIHKHGHMARSSPTPREIRQRYHRIKIAAYASMASAVGTRRVWSQALLWKIRNRNAAVLKRINRTHHQPMKRRCVQKLRKKNRVEVGGSGQVNRLRKVVPGGEAMDTCKLLEETAHFMKCLATQVKVMSRIAEIYST